MKNLKTGVALNEPQPLPENWGPIFGLHGFLDKIGDLSWIGPDYADLGWVEVGEGPDVPIATPSTPAELAWSLAKKLLAESDWSMLPDVPMIEGQRAKWEAYRKALREIRLHSDFPNMPWPTKPE